MEVWLAIGKDSKQDDVVAAMKKITGAKQSGPVPIHFTMHAIQSMNDDDEVAEVAPSPTKISRVSGHTIDSFMHHCDQAQADVISLSIIKFLAGCAMPFLVVQSNFFIGMLRSLNSAYVDRYLCKANTFTQKWLPKLYISVQQSMALLWKRKTGILHTIGIDGLTTAVCEKVFLVSESFGSMVSFKDLVSQDENCATGEYMAELMIDALKNGTITAGGNESDVEEYYAAVVTDNASANFAVAKIMKSRYPCVFFNGC